MGLPLELCSGAGVGGIEKYSTTVFLSQILYILL